MKILLSSTLSCLARSTGSFGRSRCGTDNCRTMRYTDSNCSTNCNTMRGLSVPFGCPLMGAYKQRKSLNRMGVQTVKVKAFVHRAVHLRWRA